MYKGPRRNQSFKAPYYIVDHRLMFEKDLTDNDIYERDKWYVAYVIFIVGNNWWVSFRERDDLKVVFWTKLTLLWQRGLQSPQYEGSILWIQQYLMKTPSDGTSYMACHAISSHGDFACHMKTFFRWKIHTTVIIELSLPK